MAIDEELEKDLKSVTAMAKRMKLKGKELSDYVHESMTRLGYKAERSYVRPKPDDGGSRRRGFFSGGNDDNDDDDDDI